MAMNGPSVENLVVVWAKEVVVGGHIGPLSGSDADLCQKSKNSTLDPIPLAVMVVLKRRSLHRDVEVAGSNIHKVEQARLSVGKKIVRPILRSCQLEQVHLVEEKALI